MTMRVDLDEVSWDDGLVVHDGVAFTGEVVEKAPDGGIVAVTTYVDGYPDGLSTEWYPSGQLKARGATRRARAVGLHQAWYPNGQLATERTFDDQGHPLSTREWGETGRLVKESIYPR